MASLLFTFRQIPTLAQMMAEKGVALEDVFRDAGFADTSSRTEITAPLAKVQKLLEVAAQRSPRSAWASSSPRASPKAPTA